MTQPSIKKNFLYNTIYEILVIIAPLITAPYISRIFGSDGVGIYSYTNAMCLYFTMLAALGIKSYGQREIAQHRENKQETSKLFWELELVCASSTLIAIIGWIFLVVFSKKYSVYYLILTMTIVATAFDISWFWAGFEQYKFIVIRNTIVKIMGIILLFIFVHKKSDLVLYMIIIAGMNLVANISMWTYLRRYLVCVDIKTLEFKKHYKQTFVYFIPTIATSIYTVLDKAMIGWITKDDNQNGYYEQATNILNLCKTMVFSVINVVSSRMSYLFAKENHEEIKIRLTQTLNFVMLISIPLVFGFDVIAARFVPFFFGEGYDETVNIIYIISPLIIVIGLSNCLGSLYFTPSGQRARSNKAIVSGAAINLFLNLFLINLLKARGAALASLIAELVITAMYIFMIRDYYPIKKLPSFMWKRVLAAGAMFGIVFFVGKVFSAYASIIVLIIQILIGVLSYFLILVLLHDVFFIDNIKRAFSWLLLNLHKNSQ